MNNKIIASLIAGVTLIGLSQSALARPNKNKTCDGKTVNVLGTNRSDTIVLNDDGTYSINGANKSVVALPFVVVGRNGKDTITGSKNDDVICGGDGNDDIKGGDGSDRLFGDNGKDTLDGDNKNNPCVPTLDNSVTCDDYIHGNNGKDTILGGLGNDILFGDNGKDDIDAGVGSDIIDGGRGKDNCTADETEVDDISHCR